jgi:hypothetical protein
MAERSRAAIPLTDIGFCHLVVGVTDMDRALAFYRSATIRRSLTR